MDGRQFPWGDRFDPAFANTVTSRSPPDVCPVRAFPLDASVYGILGLAGNVRTWCANAWTDAGPAQDGERLVLRTADPEAAAFVAVRGGAYGSRAPHCRAAGRLGDPPGVRYGTKGVRLVRSLGSAGEGLIDKSAASGSSTRNRSSGLLL